MTRSRAVAVLCSCQAVLSFGLGLAFPFFAIYLHLERGLSMTWAGVWLSLSVAASALSQGFGGSLSDRVGRRRVIVLSLWTRAATVLVLAAAVRFEWPLPWVIAVHVVSNFAANFFEPAARGWIADHTEAAGRHRAYGWLRAATHGGFAAGPAIGGFLTHRSYAAAFALSALVCSLCAAGATWLLRDDGRRGEAVSALAGFEPPRDGRFLRLCALNALLSVAMAQLVVPLSLHASRIGVNAAEIGLILSLNGALIVLLQVPATGLLGGVPLSAVLVSGALMYAAGYAGVAWAAGAAGLAAAAAVITAGELLVPAGVHTLAANMAPARSRGRYLGFLGLSRQLGSSLGPLAGCAGLETAERLGYAAHYWMTVSAVGIASAAGFFLLGRSLRPDEQGLGPVVDDGEDNLLPMA